MDGYAVCWSRLPACLLAGLLRRGKGRDGWGGGAWGLSPSARFTEHGASQARWNVDEAAAAAVMQLIALVVFCTPGLRFGGLGESARAGSQRRGRRVDIPGRRQFANYPLPAGPLPCSRTDGAETSGAAGQYFFWLAALLLAGRSLPAKGGPGSLVASAGRWAIVDRRWSMVHDCRVANDALLSCSSLRDFSPQTGIAGQRRAHTRLAHTCRRCSQAASGAPRCAHMSATTRDC